MTTDEIVWILFLFDCIWVQYVHTIVKWCSYSLAKWTYYSLRYEKLHAEKIAKAKAQDEVRKKEDEDKSINLKLFQLYFVIVFSF